MFLHDDFGRKIIRVWDLFHLGSIETELCYSIHNNGHETVYLLHFRNWSGQTRLVLLQIKAKHI